MTETPRSDAPDSTTDVSDPWQLKETGDTIQIRFEDLTLVSPAGNETSAPAELRWGIGDTLELEVETHHSPFPTHSRERGDLKEGEDLWAARGRTDNGFVLDAENLQPEVRRDPVYLPSVREGTLRFTPERIELARSRPRAEAPVYRGIVQSSSLLPWGEISEVMDRNPMSGGLFRRRDSLHAELPGGIQFHLRKLTPGTNRLVLLGSSADQLAVTSRHLLLGIGIATGTNCRWICRGSEQGAKQRLVLRPPHDESSFVPQFAPLPTRETPANTKGFLTFLSCFVNACERHPDFHEAFALLRPCWDSVTAPLELRALVASSVLDLILSRIHGHLPIPRHPEAGADELRAVRQALRTDTLRDSTLVPAILRYIKDPEGPVHPDRLLDALDQADHPLLTKRERESLRVIRDRLSRGWYRYESSDLLTRLGHIFNVINKIILTLVGYRGPFRDYGQKGWPTRKFPPDED